MKATVLIGLLALAACSERPLSVAEYACAGRAIRAEFYEDYAMVAFKGEGPERFERVVSASGAKYERKLEKGSMVLWTKGGDATLIIDDKEIFGCAEGAR
ncbi:MAG: MliC family protein [Rickettsiales bacterium]|jgi:membrane-bound inhibitor of C-type lysozyme|nr:MliC family protein [Rickettsiales bacterium]